MIKSILDTVEIPYRETRFIKPPKGAYVVYDDDYSAGGADGLNLIRRHSVTLQLFTTDPGDQEQVVLEAALDAAGFEWEKDAAAWEDQAQRYQTNYYFDYVEKRRAKT